MNNTYTTKKQSKTSSSEQIKQMVIAAVFIALTYVFTAFVNVRLPFGGNGGLIHLGNIPLFIGAILFGRKTGALAGGIGMAMFDVLSGWTLWAPFTLITVGLMGYVVGAVTEKKHGFVWNLTAMLMALGIKIIGYYIAEGIIAGNWIVPVYSIPGNIIQVGTAIVVVLLVAGQLEKAARKLV
ncbi:MAG: ECF transporter S component [bacterium]|nr:ECF transporter S component [bacterium]